METVLTSHNALRDGIIELFGRKDLKNPIFVTLRCGGKSLDPVKEELAVQHLYCRTAQKIAGNNGKRNKWKFRPIFEGCREKGTRHLHILTENPRAKPVERIWEVFVEAYLHTDLVGQYGKVLSKKQIENFKNNPHLMPKNLVDIREVSDIDGLANYLSKSCKESRTEMESTPFTAWR